MEFLASAMDFGGNVPMIGDADDGYVTRLSPQKNFNPYRSLLATGAILFKRGDFKVKAGSLDDKTGWLLGEEAEKEYTAIDTNQSKIPVKTAFPEGGYYILGCDFETEKEIRLIADTGPLGYLSLAAHGHADALAIVLSVGGKEILIDPGTFAYHTKKKWREYFRGTGGHNTLRIDGLNQSVSGGNFLWLQKAHANCKSWETNEKEDRLIGCHDGYLRLADPVRHTREICLRKSEGKIVVTDILECKERHLIERFWHFSEHCRITQKEQGLVVENQGVEVHFLPLSDGGETILCHGESSPPCGWVSRRYDFKEPIIMAVFRNRINGNTRLMTEIVLTRRHEK